jgi:phosphatidyl-myo-inositol dimannoside synthase
MRILIPTVDYPPIEGGISTVAVQVSRALARQGHEVTVVAPAFPDMEQFDEDEPVRVVRFPGYDRGWFRLIPLLRCAWPLVRETERILAINVAYGGILGYFARARYGISYINFAYAYEFLKFAKNPVARILLRGIYHRGSRCIAISKFTRENLIEFGVRETLIRVVLPGATPAKEVPGEVILRARHQLDLHETPLILAVGRFIPRKGHFRLVEALPHIQERLGAVQLVMVGQGPERERCLKKAEALGIEGSVRCPGYVEDDILQALYTNCECFALPTGEDEQGHVEGFGLVFTEAHAHGKPVVAGRSGGVTDAVLDGKTGLLVPPENLEDLVEALCTLLSDQEHAATLGEAGRKRVEDALNWDRFTEQILSDD